MKSLCALFLSVFCVSLSFAAQIDLMDKEPCRSYFQDLNPELNPVEQVRLDLIQGAWQTETVQAVDWSFRPDGSLVVVRKEGQRYTAEQAKWTVQYHHTGAVLYLNDLAKNKELRYFVQQTCDGINLENIDTEELLQLNYVKGASTQHQMALRSIRGHWEHTLETEAIEAIPTFTASGSGTPIRAKVMIDFKADGTFAQTLFCADKAIKKTTYGEWALSPNGKFLIVSTLDDSKEVRCLPIQYLELDEMVLSQILPADQVIKADKGFYFNKS